MKKRTIYTLRQPLKGIFTKMYRFCGVFLACVMIFTIVFGNIESFASPAGAGGSVAQNDGHLVSDEMEVPLESGEIPAVAPGDLVGNYMGIMPMTNVTTWAQLRQAITLAVSTPTRIYLMASVINTNDGVNNSTPIHIGANQNITLINGQAGANSRVTILRNGIPSVTGSPGANNAYWRRGH